MCFSAPCCYFIVKVSTRVYITNYELIFSGGDRESLGSGGKCVCNNVAMWTVFTTVPTFVRIHTIGASCEAKSTCHMCLDTEI